MIITTRLGKELDTGKLPDTYEPAHCGSCGCRLGWRHDPASDDFYGLCDDCAAALSQGDLPDPFDTEVGEDAIRIPFHPAPAESYMRMTIETETP